MLTELFRFLFLPRKRRKIVAIVLENIPVWDDNDRIVAWRYVWREIRE